MQKLLTMVLIIFSLLVVGCTQTKNTINEKQDINYVYCDSCAAESKEVTKFCSNCGKEAKWVAEKPILAEAQKEKLEDNKVKKNKEKESTDKKEEVKVVREQCHNCGEYFPANELKKFYEGLLCNKCYDLPKTCANGFVGLCEGCELCEVEDTVVDERVCLVCGDTFVVGTPGTFATSGPDYCSVECKKIGDDEYGQ